MSISGGWWFRLNGDVKVDEVHAFGGSKERFATSQAIEKTSKTVKI